MNLQTRCTSCGEFIRFKKRAVDRFELANKIGDRVELTCKYCNSAKRYNLNDIKAKPNKLIGLFAALILVVGTAVALIFVLGFINKWTNPHGLESIIGLIGIPFSIYAGITYSQRQRVNYFNAKKYGWIHLVTSIIIALSQKILSSSECSVWTTICFWIYIFWLRLSLPLEQLINTSRTNTHAFFPEPWMNCFPATIRLGKLSSLLLI